MATIKVRGVVPIAAMRGDSQEDTGLLRDMYREAREFLRGFAWCDKIVKAHFGFGIGGVVAVFFFEIQSKRSDVDRALWVIVGDLPPAYLVVDKSPTPRAALRTYVSEMRRWIRAVRAGKSVENLIPVNVPPDKLWAGRLEKRLEFLESDILPHYQSRL